MADKKISQLTALSAANLAPSTDVLAIVDTSATETKKIVAQDLINGVLNVASAVGIGTASPTFGLGTGVQIAGAGYAALSLKKGSAGTGHAIDMVDSSNTLQFRIGTNFAGGGNNLLFAYGTTPTIGMVMDTSGNLGLGVTPSAWSSAVASQVGYGAALSSRSAGNTASDMTHAAYWNGTNWLYQHSSVGAARYQMTGANAGSTHAWFVSAGGTAGNTISFTQAMTLTAAGDLGVGTTSPGAKLEVYGGASGTVTNVAVGNASTAFQVGVDSSNNIQLRTAQNVSMLFYTNNTERGRFTAGGYFKASDTGTYRNAAGVYHELRNSDGNNPTVFVTNSNASTPYGIAVEFTAAAPDNNTQFFFRAEDTGAVRCYIWSDGDLANHDGVYGTISDARLKQDIVDASSQWDDLKSIRFRKYRMKTDVEANPDAPAMFGVVAQELAQVCPGLVDEHPNMKTVEVTDEEGNVTQTQEPDGTTTMTVKSSILLMKAAKALQEAMARIESLEAKVSALEAK